MKLTAGNARRSDNHARMQPLPVGCTLSALLSSLVGFPRGQFEIVSRQAVTKKLVIAYQIDFSPYGSEFTRRTLSKNAQKRTIHYPRDIFTDGDTAIYSQVDRLQ